MADVVRKVEYFSIEVPNTPGKAFGVLSTFVSSGVDLLACAGVPHGRRARIDVVPADPAKFKRVVKKAGLPFESKKTGFLIQGSDRSGALTDHLKKLGDGGINVTGIDALSAGQGRWGAIIWVDAAAVRKAAGVLQASAAATAKPRKAPAPRRR
jgi:prephenate dehydratase